MRSPRFPALLFFLAACAAPAHLVRTADDASVAVDDAARSLAGADVVVLGELHETPAVHELHQALLRALYARRGELAIAMEMFERDVQTPLLQYLGGLIDEPTFLARSRPWRNYQRDYRPVVEFAKEHGLVVLAANAPTALVHEVGVSGIGSVAGNPDVARETSAPEDEYYDDFVKMMGDHVGTSGDGGMQRVYAAQCLRDDTMAETVVDHLERERAKGQRPLVVLFCGNMHANFRRGTVARILSRAPQLDVRVLSVEDTAGLAGGTYASPRHIGDYVVVVHGGNEPVAREAMPVVAPAAAPQRPAPAVDHAKPVAKSDQPASKPLTRSEAPAAAEGEQPGLGLMPDYQATDDGVRVAGVREGGPADRAGVREGDLIIGLAGEPVAGVAEYAAILRELAIGSTVPVKVRRGATEVDLNVQVGTRSR